MPRPPVLKPREVCRILIDVLATMEAANELAETDTEEGPDTGERDSAYNELKEYMKELKGVSRAAFREQPDVLEKLGL